MALLTTPVQRARMYLDLAAADSLVRNSLFMMSSTVVTAGLGYVFWIITAHIFTSAQVGIGSAVISLCSTSMRCFEILAEQKPPCDISFNTP